LVPASNLGTIEIKKIIRWERRLMLVISATSEAEIGGLWFKATQTKN
jgi:hypothetical protein